MMMTDIVIIAADDRRRPSDAMEGARLARQLYSAVAAPR